MQERQSTNAQNYIDLEDRYGAHKLSSAPCRFRKKEKAFMSGMSMVKNTMISFRPIRLLIKAIVTQKSLRR